MVTVMVTALPDTMVQEMKSRLRPYYSPKLIMAIDLGLSLLSSGLSLLVLRWLYAISFQTVPLSNLGRAWFVSAALMSFVSLFLTKCYRNVVRYCTVHDIAVVMLFAFIKTTVPCLLLLLTQFHTMLWPVVVLFVTDFLSTLLFLSGYRMAVSALYTFFKLKTNEIIDSKRALIFGNADSAAAIIPNIDKIGRYQLVGVVVDDESNSTVDLMGVRIYACPDCESLKRLADSLSVRHIIFPSEDEVMQHRDIVEYCSSHGLKILVSSSVDEVVDGRIMRNKVRDVKIEDLLGRKEIKLDMQRIVSNFSGKVVMVTGAAGSIGSELCRQLAGFGIGRLILFDNAETPMHNLRLELEERCPALQFVPVVGDVRQLPRLDFAFRKYRPQVVFHAAAYKHVPLMEENPCEAVLVNVNGTRNVADKCIEYGVEKMVMVSTDKAVNPTNIMGCTKRLAEIYVQSLGLAIEHGGHEGKTRFVTTRFGNVLGSNGSVIPRFREQIEKGGPVTVTHPEITRFFMTIPEACRLVMEAATLTTGNQIFVFDMGESVRIKDLAVRMIKLAGLKPGEDIDIEYTGLRPGEKLYEEVLSDKENTEPTPISRIRIAKAREYSYPDALKAVDRLTSLAFDVLIPDMVRLMKEVVPEFKSRNSEFERYDIA